MQRNIKQFTYYWKVQ